MVPLEVLLFGGFVDERLVPQDSAQLLIEGLFPEGHKIVTHVIPVFLEGIGIDLPHTVDHKSVFPRLHI